MNILLINLPSRKGKSGFMLPLGLLYVGGIIERSGHKAKILDLYLDDVELKDFDHNKFGNINKVIENHKPSIIGFGGIVTSYSRTKRLTQYIKNNYPDIFQIAGGPLSSVYDLLLTKAKIDIVFHGETEISLPIFLEKYAQKKTVSDAPGISYLSDNKRVITTSPPEQIKNLDSITFPAYHLIDINQYLHSIEDHLNSYKLLFNNNSYISSTIKNTIDRKSHYIPMVTARGCTHRCIFCYRHTRGIRQHSPNYVIEHIKYLKKNYGIEGFQFIDELFNSNPGWILELCDLIKKEDLNIFYLVGGARVDKINKEILLRLKETGCIEIDYGQESGSDIILEEYKKGISVQQNKEITALTKTIGIFCAVQIVIGSPSETNDTIGKTIQFLKSVDAYQYSLNYLIPLPETPIWQYVEKLGLVTDLEKYLDLVAEYGGSPLINLTKVHDKVWKNWGLLIRKELNLHYYRKKNLKLYYFYKLLYILTDKILPFIPQRVTKSIPKWIKSWYWIPRM